MLRPPVFPVSTVLVDVKQFLNPASVNISRFVNADFFALVYLYDPAILDYQGNCSETN